MPFLFCFVAFAYVLSLNKLFSENNTSCIVTPVCDGLNRSLVVFWPLALRNEAMFLKARD